MITVRRADERGGGRHGWLTTRHTFSFADYYDPEWMGFGPLRVINEDFIEPRTGFDTHGHRDMEIITYVLDGAVAHKDDLGNAYTIPAGEIQRMSAGSGIRHSEHNPSDTETLHLYQIWIEPNQTGVAPGYEQKPFPGRNSPNQLHVFASGAGGNGGVKIHQDAVVLAGRIEQGAHVDYAFAPGRRAWIQVARGGVTIHDATLHAGDGAGIQDEDTLTITAIDDTEVLLFDLP